MNRIIDEKRTNGTVTAPVTLAEAKKVCIVDHSLDDTLIEDLIIQCAEEIENICRISILDKTIIITVDLEEECWLPYPPVKSITEVKLRTGTDVSGVAEYNTLVAGEYTTDGEQSIVFNSSMCGRHKITYTAGMTTVSEALKKALLNLIAFRYQNRGDHEVELSEDVRQQILQFKEFSWA